MHVMLLSCCVLVLLMPGRCFMAPTFKPVADSSPSTEPQADLKLATVSAWAGLHVMSLGKCKKKKKNVFRVFFVTVGRIFVCLSVFVSPYLFLAAFKWHADILVLLLHPHGSPVQHDPMACISNLLTGLPPAVLQPANWADGAHEAELTLLHF